MKLSQLYEAGSWEAVAGHPGKMGDKGKVSVHGKGKRRMSFLKHPEDRDTFFKEDDDISVVGSKKYSDDTIKHVRQGGTANVGEVHKPASSDIDDVGSSGYTQKTIGPSRKWIGGTRKLGQLKF